MGIAPSQLQFRASKSVAGAKPAQAILAVCRAVAAAPVAAARAERERWALWLPVALGAGIGVYFAVPAEPSRTVALVAGLLALGLTITALKSSHDGMRAIASVLAAILIGFGLAKWRTETVAAPVLTHRIGPVELDARVEWAQAHAKGTRVLLAPLRVGVMRQANLPRYVRIFVRSGGSDLTPGALVRTEAVLMPPPPPAAPDDYDFGRAAYFDGIGAVGYAFGTPRILSPPPAENVLQRGVNTWRWRMAQRVHSVLPGSTGAIAAALITGDRGGISDADEQALRDAGLAHVLAIAGLHMALVGLGLFWVCRALLALVPAIALTQPIKKWAAVAALAGTGFYLVISGAANPAVRAFVMLAAMLLAIIVDRPALSMRSLAFAAAIILFMRPESLIEPGFQMSFAAVGCLIAIAEWEQRRSARRLNDGLSLPFPKVRRYLRGIAVTSVVGSIATMPYAAFHFDRATHYALLGNLLAMPIMGFVTMPAAAISIMLMPLHLDALPLHVMGWGIEAMLVMGRWVSHLPGAVSSVAAWPVSALALMSLGGLWMVIWRRAWRLLGLVPALVAIAVIRTTVPPDILVARDGQTAAIRAGDGKLYLVTRPLDEYSASEWLKRDGDSRTALQSIGGPSNGVRCDAFGCTAGAHSGALIAVSFRRDAVAEDCSKAYVVVSAVPLRGSCTGPRAVIDRFDVARNGAHAIWLGDKVRVETVRQERGDRPWSRER
ncbi:MAG: ComEC/Rec2 family competence protein [Rhizomicrobium sp.]